jgi:hypothetical protein
MKAWARETFDWDRVARQWDSVFQKHLGNRAQRPQDHTAQSGAAGEL